MPRRVSSMVLAFLAVVPAVGEATIQDPAPITPRDTYWVGVGLGVGSEDAGGHLNGSYQFGANLISLRAAVTAGLFDDGVTDYALLYGRATRGASSDCRSSCKRSGVPANWWDWGSMVSPTSTQPDRLPV